MRHRKHKITLDRKIGPRRALLRHLAESLILYDKISTTRAKAKALRTVVERLVTTAKVPGLTARRRLLQTLPNKNAVNKLMEVLGPRYAQRLGGYTRSTIIRRRVGDGAEEALVEFV